MARSRVVVIKNRLLSSPGMNIDSRIILSMLERGFSLIQEDADAQQCLRTIFRSRDRIGIKINTLGGKKISTRPELALTLADYLNRHASDEGEITIWDRSNRELRDAGYRLNLSRGATKVYGTDSGSIGYETELRAHLNIGSLFSTIQTRKIDAAVSLAILKDHGLAGVTAGMKNYYGAIHNPNKYHDTHCNPFVAELNAIPVIRKKHRLSLLDALIVQYHRGPSFHEKWAERFGGLIFSTDPVAADAVGWQVIERLRKAHGLPSLEEEERMPIYIKTAEAMGLGHASPENITIIEEEV